MAILAELNNGSSEITVKGLHQWDYGQQLQIKADDLIGDIEVHFACPGMKEAVVRNCAVIGGIATASIPDQCLEQTAPVIAWVYVIEGTIGTTTKTIRLPIIPRTKPHPGRSVPPEISDKYTEAITAMNALVAEFEEIADNTGNTGQRIDDIMDGSLVVAKAERSHLAESASSADRATTAQHADWSDIALYASTDQSKGTIEERLSAMGFKEGAFEIIDPEGTQTITVLKNSLKRIGKYVIAELFFSGNVICYADIPDEFLPKSEVVFRNGRTVTLTTGGLLLNEDVTLPHGENRILVVGDNWHIVNYAVWEIA